MLCMWAAFLGIRVGEAQHPGPFNFELAEDWDFDAAAAEQQSAYPADDFGLAGLSQQPATPEQASPLLANGTFLNSGGRLES